MKYTKYCAKLQTTKDQNGKLTMTPTIKSWLFIMLIILAMTYGFKEAYTWLYKGQIAPAVEQPVVKD